MADLRGQQLYVTVSVRTNSPRVRVREGLRLSRLAETIRAGARGAALPKLLTPR
jgi:hypothetical protein